MNPVTKTVDEIADLIDRLSSEERAQLLGRIALPAKSRRTPGYTPSFYEAQKITAHYKGSLADDVIADREDRL